MNAVPFKHNSPDAAHKLIVDLFAGGGGMSSAVEEALGRSPDIAVNHCEAALSLHRENHPQTRHFIADVWEVDPRGATQGRPVGLLHLSPDCFPAGTVILTRQGYRPIETIRVGDSVLTHRGRWRRVTATMTTEKPLLTLKGEGHPGIRVSAEHPFFIRRFEGIKSTEPPSLSDPDWIASGQIRPGDYWGAPARFEALPVPEIEGFPVDERLMRLAGRYLRNGLIHPAHPFGSVVIFADASKHQHALDELNQWPEPDTETGATSLSWSCMQSCGKVDLVAQNRALAKWLLQFGGSFSDRVIPGWVYGMNESMRSAFLEGYMSPSNWLHTGRQSSSATSKPLALGISTLLASFGRQAHIQPLPNQAFLIQWEDDTESEVESGLLWSPISAVEEGDGTPVLVFNLSVEDDESYVAEGIVAHNCTHHSQARGGQSRDKKIRALTWVGRRWAGQALPDIITLENVKQIQSWGPLIARRDKETGRVIKLDGTVAAPGERVPIQQQYLVPDPARKGKTWRQFVASLEGLGYVAEWRVLSAADYGAPTTRERLFMVARRDGQPIVWPEPTHAKTPGKGLQRWRSAADCIDWSIPGRSIFDREKPLAEQTLRRIAKGVQQYILDAEDPFLVPSGQTRWQLCGSVVVPLTHQGGVRVHDVRDPCRTITAAHRGEFALACAYIMQANGGHNVTLGRDPRQPLTAITSRGSQQQLVTATLAHFRGNCDARDLSEPLRTISEGGEHHGIIECTLSNAEEDDALRVAAFLMRYHGNGGQWSDLRDPATTITTKARLGLVTVMVKGAPYLIADIGLRMLTPRELFSAQGFREDYTIDRGHDGRIFPKSTQIRLVGNSVSPPPAVALLRANAGDLAIRTLAKAC